MDIYIEGRSQKGSLSSIGSSKSKMEVDYVEHLGRTEDAWRDVSRELIMDEGNKLINVVGDKLTKLLSNVGKDTDKARMKIDSEFGGKVG